MHTLEKGEDPSHVCSPRISVIMSDSWTYANYQPYQQRHYTDQKNDYRVRSNSNGQAPGKWWKQGQAVKLFVCCILGIAVGVGHHMYYSYLDGREASNQSVSCAEFCIHKTKFSYHRSG